jgi:signal transduction histidine kinase
VTVPARTRPALQPGRGSASARKAATTPVSTSSSGTVSRAAASASGSIAAITVRRSSLEATGPELVGTWDRARLERVVENLLANALKFSPEGGRITLSLAREDHHAVLRVRDQGLGIPPADLPHIFEWFRRGSNASGRIAGSGVGLPAARLIVAQHGGMIQAASTEGQGSTFTVVLPLDP